MRPAFWLSLAVAGAGLLLLLLPSSASVLTGLAPGAFGFAALPAFRLRMTASAAAVRR